MLPVASTWSLTSADLVLLWDAVFESISQTDLTEPVLVSNSTPIHCRLWPSLYSPRDNQQLASYAYLFGILNPLLPLWGHWRYCTISALAPGFAARSTTYSQGFVIKPLTMSLSFVAVCLRQGLTWLAPAVFTLVMEPRRTLSSWSSCLYHPVLESQVWAWHAQIVN